MLSLQWLFFVKTDKNAENAQTAQTAQTDKTTQNCRKPAGYLLIGPTQKPNPR